ncbi:MAG: energy-coupling factor transporter ATPase [Ruminococcaceae bacterium]|nr:energy-coupling factor transporter ATPase [Oscillospiraceae bacterium]
MSEFIRAENLSFSYEEGAGVHPAISDFSVTIHSGEYVAVLGHNGSGKSTFAKLLNMILTPSAGRLFVAGEELTGEDFDEEALFRLRGKVGMVFQNPDNQIVASVVEEDVAFGPENLGVPYEEIHERVAQALRAVDMTAYAKHSPARLSGGQKQRVAIAGVIAMLPECIILDESTAMLDPKGRREVLDVVEKLNRERGMTLLHITHYMDEAARADRVLVIDGGKLLLDGTPREVFSQVELLTSVGLETPQPTRLLYELKQAGLSMPDGCIGIEECASVIAELWKG